VSNEFGFRLNPVGLLVGAEISPNFHRHERQRLPPIYTRVRDFMNPLAVPGRLISRLSARLRLEGISGLDFEGEPKTAPGLGRIRRGCLILNKADGLDTGAERRLA
jgi:hypothetical protein